MPWPDQKLEYWMKFRIYFQDHDPLALLGMVGHHIETFDITWSIAGATGEYDVPQCKAGTPTEECKHEITGIIVPPGDDLHFVAAVSKLQKYSICSHLIWILNSTSKQYILILSKLFSFYYNNNNNSIIIVTHLHVCRLKYGHGTM